MPIRVSGPGVSSFKGVLTVPPTYASYGDTYINSVTNGLYIYYYDWVLIFTFSAVVRDAIKLEDGTYILMEDGSKLLLEV